MSWLEQQLKNPEFAIEFANAAILQDIQIAMCDYMKKNNITYRDIAQKFAKKFYEEYNIDINKSPRIAIINNYERKVKKFFEGGSLNECGKYLWALGIELDIKVK